MYIKKLIALALGITILALSVLSHAEVDPTSFPIGTFNCKNSGFGYNVEHMLKISKVSVGTILLPLVEYTKKSEGEIVRSYKGLGAITSSNTIFPFEVSIPTSATNFPTSFRFNANKMLKNVSQDDCE